MSRYTKHKRGHSKRHLPNRGYRLMGPETPPVLSKPLQDRAAHSSYDFRADGWVDISSDIHKLEPRSRVELLLGHTVLQRKVLEREPQGSHRRIFGMLFSSSVEIASYRLLHELQPRTQPEKLIRAYKYMLQRIGSYDREFKSVSNEERLALLKRALFEAHVIVGTTGQPDADRTAQNASEKSAKTVPGLLTEYRIVKTLQEIGWPQARYSTISEDLRQVDAVVPLDSDPSYPGYPPVEMQLKSDGYIKEIQVYRSYTNEGSKGAVKSDRPAVPLIVVSSSNARTNLFGATDVERNALRDFMHEEIERLAA